MNEDFLILMRIDPNSAMTARSPELKLAGCTSHTWTRPVLQSEFSNEVETRHKRFVGD